MATLDLVNLANRFACTLDLANERLLGKTERLQTFVIIAITRMLEKELE